MKVIVWSCALLFPAAAIAADPFDFCLAKNLIATGKYDACMYKAVAKAGASVLRGSAFASRARPYSFQGLGEEALGWLRDAADANDLLVASEVVTPSHIELVVLAQRLLQPCGLLRVGRLDVAVGGGESALEGNA